MSCTLTLEQGNTPVLQATVVDTLTGVPRNDAVVVVSVSDSAGVPVTGGPVWPVTLAYLAGSAGVYRAQLPTTTAFLPGLTYAATFVITVDAVDTTFVYPLYVQPLGAPAPDAPACAPQGVSLWTYLQEAEAAYHAMLTGKNVATIKDQNGEEVTYSMSNRSALAQYIYSLKSQLGLAGGGGPATVGFGQRGRRPLGYRQC